jgi:broad specificity phosphatase PhoE
MNKLYIVRHGKTDWNNKHFLQGSIDIEMNNDGIEEVKQLANTINLNDMDLCLCSPLVRARKTAEILVNNKIPIIYDDLLKERNFGDYEGQKTDYDLMVKQWNYKLNDSSHNIESVHDCLKRANILLNKIKKNYPNKSILLVTHGSFMKALHYNIIGYNKNTDFLSFNPENATLYEYILK